MEAISVELFQRLNTFEKIVDATARGEITKDTGFWLVLFLPIEKPVKTSYVYLFRDINNGHYKVGVSQNVEKRRNDIANISGRTIEIVSTFKGTAMQESKIHRLLSRIRLNGEWFENDISVEEVFQAEKLNQETLERQAVKKIDAKKQRPPSDNRGKE